MPNYTQESEVLLRVNDKEATSKLAGLESKAASLRKSFEEAFRKGDTAGIQNINKELIKVNKEISNMRSNADNIRAAMTQLDKATPKELQRTIKAINTELNSGRVVRGSKEWDAYISKLHEAQAELKKVKEEMAGLDEGSGFLEELKDKFNEWGASIAAVAAGFAGVVMSGKAAVKAYADMEQEEANVRKFTGMTADQVAALNEEFKKMDTRTSREDLNKLAQEAGRLGKQSQEDVLGFVAAADKINVALDDLGDGATLSLSKLTGIFGDEKIYGTEQSLLKVGSVINELSQNCSASAPFISEFTSRIGGIAAQSKLTISQVMAFAAVLDTQNMELEASSTALGQLIANIYKDPAKIAKAAGIDVKQFSELVKKDMNGALIMLFEQMNKMGGMETLAKVFDEMGSDGARASAVMAALAGHISEVKDQQEVANEAFEQGISIENEFNVQNSTVQAGLDKAKKGFNELAISLGEKLLPVMRYCISGTSMLMRVMDAIISFIAKNRAAIAALVLALAGYTAAVNAAVISTKLKVFWNEKLLVSLTKLYAAVLRHPWGIAVAALALVIGKLIDLARQNDTVSESIKTLNGIRKDAATKLEEEKYRIEQLIKVANDEKVGLDERHKAIDRLNKIIPGYNAQLDETTGKYTANAAALDQYLKQLKKQYELEGARAKLSELGKERAEANVRLIDARKAAEKFKHQSSNVTQFAGNSVAGSVGVFSIAAGNMEMAVSKAEEKLARVDAKIKAITDAYGTSMWTQDAEANASDGTNGTSFTLPETEKERKAREKAAREAEKAERKAQREAREALKKDLDERKSMQLQAEAENLTMYVTGQKNYQEYCESRESLESQYVDDVIKIHEDHNKLDIAAYGQALKSKAELLKKHQDEERAMSLEALEKEHNSRTDSLTSSLYDPNSAIFGKQKAYNQALLEADIDYLKKKAALYLEGSKERAKVEEEIQDRINKDQLEKQKETAEAIKNYREQFGDAGRAAAYRAEIAALDLLHKQGLIKEEEYQQALEGIRSKYRTENMSESMKSIEELFSRAVKLATGKLGEASEVITGFLNGMSKEEREKLPEGFEKGFDNIIGKTLITGLGGVESLIEGFNEAAKGNWKDLIGKLGETAQAAANIIGGISSTFSDYWNAQRDIEIANIEKRYDKEIEAAGKNSKKKEKLEKQKEANIAKVKKKYNDRAMKMEIAQAIAQTAANALGAFGAMVEIPVVGPALAAAAAAMATAAGMVQVAIIKKQHQAQEAGYYSGGYTKKDANNRKAVGVVHANEFVANHQAVANPAISPVLDLIDRAQRTNTVGRLTSRDISNALGQGEGVSARGVVAGNNQQVAEVRTLVGDFGSSVAAPIDRLSELLEQGIEAHVIMDGEQGLARKLERFNRLTSNPKR